MAVRLAVHRFAPRAIAQSNRPILPSHIDHDLTGCRIFLRTFLNVFDAATKSAPQTIQAHRILPYSSSLLYDIIADIDSYSSFLPNCTASRVTAWTSQDHSSQQSKHGRRWPTAGTLTAGWGEISQTYSSRVFCIPDLGIVEAISGDAETDIAGEDLRRWRLSDSQQAREVSSIFRSLVTRWTVRPRNRQGQEEIQQWSEVDLSIKYQFANPLYGAVSSAVAGKIAPMMVAAFEEEALRRLGPPKRS